MPSLQGLEWTFDTVASVYEKLRPGYVKELYQTLFDYIPIDKNSNVVEIGSGGAFVRFANHPYQDKANPSLSQEIEKIYDKYYYKYYKKECETISEYTEQEAKEP